MAIALDSLIQDVEKRAPSPEPLALLATASATVSELNETTDALLSHFVDRSRRAGHSWSEIGEALGVSKQAVQKRFTPETLPGYMQWTPRVRRLITKGAEKIAKERRRQKIGTEELLLALASDEAGLAAHALADASVDLIKLAAALPVRGKGAVYEGGYSPDAWEVIEQSPMTAVHLGHNYVGTEHVLIALFSSEGRTVRVLDELGVKLESVTAYVKKTLGTP